MKRYLETIPLEYPRLKSEIEGKFTSVVRGITHDSDHGLHKKEVRGLTKKHAADHLNLTIKYSALDTTLTVGPLVLGCSTTIAYVPGRLMSLGLAVAVSSLLVL